MFILHLCFDGNFVSHSYHVFEKYYPNKNLFIVNKESDKFKIIKDKEHFLGIPLKEKNYRKIKDLCDVHGVNIILVHGLQSTYAGLLKYLSSVRNYRVYWIFWGYELYLSLAQLGRYELIDEEASPFSLRTYMYPNKYNVWLRKFLRKPITSNLLYDLIPYLDYFCFWNYEDYKLLQDEFQTNMKFKYFAYSASERDEKDFLLQSELPIKNQRTLLINHQASITGNHYTLMKHIASIDKDNVYEKLVPLSYGTNYIRKSVLRAGQSFFNAKFHPILGYLPRSEYFEMINRAEVAIFGARRQEASGNIINLLGNGTKVFLRDDNNLLQYYKKKGFIIYSYDKDLNSIEDLQPLTLEEQQYNRECRIKNKVYYDQFMPSLFE